MQRKVMLDRGILLQRQGTHYNNGDGHFEDYDEGGMDRSHVSLDISLLGHSTISGLTLEAGLMTNDNTTISNTDQWHHFTSDFQEIHVNTPRRNESQRNSTSDYYTIEEDSRKVALVIEQVEKELKFHEMLSQMHHFSASIDDTMITSKRNHQYQHQPLGTVTETMEQSMNLDRDHYQEEERAHGSVRNRRTDPCSLASNIKEYMNSTSSELRGIPDPAPSMLQQQVPDKKVKPKKQYSSQTIGVKADALTSCMDSPTTHQITVSPSSTASKRTSNKSGNGKLLSTSSPSNSLKKKLRHNSNEILHVPAVVTLSPKHSSPSSAGVGAQNSTQNFGQHLSRNESPASNRLDSTSPHTNSVFGASYIMESPTSSNPSVDATPRRTVPHHDAASFDQPCAPARAHLLHVQGLISNEKSTTFSRDMTKERVTTANEGLDLHHSCINLEKTEEVAKNREFSSKMTGDAWVHVENEKIGVKEMTSMGSNNPNASSKAFTNTSVPRAKEGSESITAFEEMSMCLDAVKAPAKIVTKVWVPIGDEGDVKAFTKYSNAKKAKRKDKKYEKDGTAATRRRDIKLDIMKRLSDEQVRDPEKPHDATDTPVVSIGYIMTIQNDDDDRVSKGKQIRKDECPHSTKTTSPETFESPSQPKHGTQREQERSQPNDDMNDRDIETGVPSGTQPTRQLQRMMTAYSSVASSDTFLSDDGIYLLQVERRRDGHRLDKPNAKFNSTDLVHAYAVEVPRGVDNERNVSGKSIVDQRASTNTSYKRKRCFLCFAAVVLISTLATLSFIFFTKKSNTGNLNVPQIETTSPSGSPTFSRDELQILILTLSPDTNVTLGHDSPQRKAFNWLVSPVNDAYFGDHRRLLQRFALAVFFYSTGGPRWSSKSGWMTSDSECTWEYTSHTDHCDSDGNIIWIDIKENALVGAIPLEISSLLPFLRGIDLSRNQLYEVFPIHLQQLTALEFYFVEENDIVGSIPSEIGLMTNLQLLSLSQNRLKGSIPTEIGRLTNLKHFELSKNSLTGILPSEVGLLRNVQRIDIGFNQIKGTLPVQIQSLFALEDLTLCMNLLTGSIPTVYGKLVALTSLSIDFNKLIGQVPSEFGKLTTLKTIWLQSNFINGTIPREVGSMINLTWLDMSLNLLNGKIPEEIGYLTLLEVLNLQDNNLKGKIPRSLGNSTALSKILLRGNHFTGTIPSSLGRLFLHTLDLASNDLSGQIPEELAGGIAHGALLNVSENNMTGSVPVGLCYFLATNKGQLEVDCVAVSCDSSCCPSCAFQSSGGIFGG